MILKMTKNQSFTFIFTCIFLKYILGISNGFLGLSWIPILNETSILVFAELAIFHSI